jgi:hypothetical protein
MSVLRPRRIYWRPTNSFGFGRRRPEQPDLVESEFQIGWRVLVICRVDLLDDHQRVTDENARIKNLAREAGDNVARGMAAIDVEIARRLGGGPGR